MNGSKNQKRVRNGKSSRNTAVRLFAAFLIIVSVFFALDSMGFFNEAVDYSPAIENYFHASVSPSGDPSYTGCEQMATTSVGSAENNDFSFNNDSLSERIGRTEIIGGGKDIFTVMIYMCAGDMESSFGLASADIEEMLQATRSSKLNIIIQTGGSTAWDNTSVKTGRIQRFKISNGKLHMLASGNDVKMSTYANLTSFIRYCKEKFPANRYALVLWGNSGGTVGGYSYDETHITGNSMTAAELNQALYSADVKFDFIGFDAGFTATYEIAHVMNYYADYLVASQETVASPGWNYTGWLSAIAKNTSIETTEIAKIIIDDYKADCHRTAETNVSTLSVIDLCDFNNLVRPAMTEFFSYVDELINSGKYSCVAKAAAATRSFGGSDSGMLDLMEFAERIGSDKGNQLVDALKNTVKYNAVSLNTVNANGMSIYFPYRDFERFDNTLSMFHRINICSEYSYALRKFANVTVGGRSRSESSNKPADDGYPFGVSVNDANSSDYKWLDNDFLETCAVFYKGNSLTADTFKTEQTVSTDGNAYTVFSLTKKEWELVADILVEAYVYDKDSGYYIFLGNDIPQLTYINEDRQQLLAEFSGAWLSIEGIRVCAQAVSFEEYDSVWKTTYRVPVFITTASRSGNDDNTMTYAAYLYITHDNRYSDNYSIAYAEKVYENGETPTRGKTVNLTDGDIITLRYDYFDSELNPVESPETAITSGTHFTYSTGTTVCMSTIPTDCEPVIRYVFYDIYGNCFKADITDSFYANIKNN